MMLQRTPDAGTSMVDLALFEGPVLPADLLQGLGVIAARPVLDTAPATTMATPSEILERRIDMASAPAHAICQMFRRNIITVFTNADLSIGKETQFNTVGRRDINTLADEWQKHPCGISNDFEDATYKLQSPLLTILEKTPDESLARVVEPLRTARLRGNRGTLGGDRTVSALCAVVGLKIVDPTTLPKEFTSTTLERLDKLAFRYRLARAY